METILVSIPKTTWPHVTTSSSDRSRFRSDTPILLTLHSKDMIHNFYVPELRIQQDIVPGIDIPLHFTATKTGRWEIVCTQLCGLGHYSMKAYLEVKSQSEYDDWLKQQSGD